MKIYVLVKVTYDHYRFEDLQVANTDLNLIMDYVDFLKTTYKHINTIAFYDKEPNNFRDDEIAHWWMKAFKINE